MNNKKIKILTSGIIPVKGFLTGPILTPHFESVEKIYRLVSSGISVVEVLNDGKEIPLNIHNYNTDNNPNRPEETIIEMPILEEDKGIFDAPVNKEDHDEEHTKPEEIIVKMPILEETPVTVETTETVDEIVNTVEETTTDEIVETVVDDSTDIKETETVEEKVVKEEKPVYNKQYQNYNKNKKRR